VAAQRGRSSCSVISRLEQHRGQLLGDQRALTSTAQSPAWQDLTTPPLCRRPCLPAGAAWHGAEAYHFWLLAHRQLYGGDPEAALRTCLALRRYEGVLGPAPVYSLLALAAFYAEFYEQCSKVRLCRLCGRRGQAGCAGAAGCRRGQATLCKPSHW
jgi:hypothetical protein